MKRSLLGLLFLGGCQCSGDSPTTTSEGVASASAANVQSLASGPSTSASPNVSSNANLDAYNAVLHFSLDGTVKVNGETVPQIEQLPAILGAQVSDHPRPLLLDIAPDLRWEQVRPIIAVLEPSGAPIQFDVQNHALKAVHPMAWWPKHPGTVENGQNGHPDQPFTFEINLRSEGLTIRHQSAPQEFHSSVEKTVQLVEHAQSTNRNNPIPVVVRLGPQISWQAVLELTQHLAPVLDPGHLAIWHQGPADP